MNLDLALSKIKLYRDLGNNKFYIMNFGVFKNLLRLYVAEGTGVSGEKSKNVFNEVVMPLNARLFGDELSKLNSRDEGYVFSIKMYSPKWVNDKMSRDEKELVGELGCGRVKNPEGDIVNVIFVVNKIGKKFTLPLVPSPYVELYKNKELIKDKETISKYWTTAYAKTYNDILAMFPEAKGNDEVKQKDDLNLGGI